MKPNISLSASSGDNWKEKAGRIGHYAKGIVYALAGILTLLSALNMGGQKAGKTQVLDFLQKQPFGNVLLILMAIGLICYAFWRFLESTQDIKNEGSDAKGRAKRVGYFISAVLYLGFGIYAITQVIGSSSSSGSGKQSMISSLLQHDMGVFIMILVAVGLFAKAIFQFYKVYKGDMTDDIQSREIPNDKAKSIVKYAGYVGFISRGILISILGYFCLKAALQSNAGQVQGSSGAFSFIQESPSGAWLMGLVAFGLLCYGIFMMIVARYSKFSA